MGNGMRAESSRLWTWMAIAAIVVVGLFVLDPFGGSDPSSDGLMLEDDGVPFIAVIEHRRAPARAIDEPEEVLDVVIEAEAMTKASVEAADPADSDSSDRGQRTSSDG